MNKKQWNIFAIVFLLMSIYFLFWNLITAGITILLVDSISTGLTFLINRLSAFLFVIFVGLSITFYICARLEPKNMEDDVPKKHKEVMKLARLEHEVKGLKNRLKREGKIKS